MRCTFRGLHLLSFGPVSACYELNVPRGGSRPTRPSLLPLTDLPSDASSSTVLDLLRFTPCPLLGYLDSLKLETERDIYIYRERVKKRRFLFERTLLIKRARLLLRFDAEERRWITLEPKLVRFEGRSVRCVSTSARCTGRESERERVRVRGGEREREALDLGTVLRVRYHSHTRE